MLVIRASDGCSFKLSSHDFNSITTITELKFNLLSPLLAIPPECLICMNQDGAQLKEEHVRELRDLADENDLTQPAEQGEEGEKRGEKRLYIFDRDHLDADPEEIAFHLAITEDQVLQEPELGREDPLLSHIHLSSHNLTTLTALTSSLRFQRDSLSLALANLQRVMTGTSNSLDSFLESNEPSIQSFSNLLNSWESNMLAITKVTVVTGLISKSSQPNVAASLANTTIKEKERFLGDYVSRDKMVAVKDGCQKVLQELLGRIDAVKQVAQEVLEGTETMRIEFEDSSNADLELCEHDAVEGHSKVEELVRIGLELNDEQLREENYEELFHLDQDSRDRIRFLVDRKNAVTRYLVVSMQRISALQSTIASMPSDLGTLDHELRTRTDNFKHLARLEGMIPAYIATVVEVVRRRLYTRLISLHTESFSTSLSPFSLAERERRVSYRANYAGKLPWEVKGLGIGSEENLPLIELRLGGTEELPELNKNSLSSLQKNFIDLEELLIAEVEIDGPITRAKNLLNTFVVEIEGLEKELENLSLDHHRTASLPEKSDEISTLVEQIKVLEESNEALSRQLQTERTAGEEAITQLNQENAVLINKEANDLIQLDKLEQDLTNQRAQQHRTQLENDKLQGSIRESKEMMDQIVEKSQKSDLELNARISQLESELSISKLATEESTRAVLDIQARYIKLQTDHAASEAESNRVRTSLTEVENRLEITESSLREMNLEIIQKERALRDFKNESNFDHAGLEQEINELKSVVNIKEEEIVAAAKESLRLESITIFLKEEMGCFKKEISSLKDDLSKSTLRRSSLEETVEEEKKEILKITEIARNAIKVAGVIKQENTTIINSLATPAPPKLDSIPLDSTSQVPTLLEPSLDFINGDLEQLLREVSKYSPNSITEAVTSLMKKCKSYREKAYRATAVSNEKIAFRNFAKGDLALFLPTRNSTAQIWAAFNVSAPHHFLSATGVVGEQIKSREWIVARIVNIEEKIVDTKDESSNPFLLAGGTKFFLIEVEGWSSKTSALGTRSRRSSSKTEGVEKGKEKEKKRDGAGHSRISKSESSATGRPSTAPAGISSSLNSATTVLVGFPSETEESGGRRSSENDLVINKDLGRREFEIIEEESLNMTRSLTLSDEILPEGEREGEEEEEAVVVPSGLTISLAKASSEELITRSDPFTTSPFSLTLAEEEKSYSEPPLSPGKVYESNLVGDIPAFLPSSVKSKLSSRYGKGIELIRSPTHSVLSEGGSAVGGGGKSPNSIGESFLSSSLYRVGTSSRTGAGGPSSSSPTPSIKGVATTSTSLKNELDGNLNSSSHLKLEGRAMSIGRNSKNWPVTSHGGEGIGLSRSPSIMEAFSRRRISVSSGGELAASEIMKALDKGKK